jgi:hypothetical protein
MCAVRAQTKYTTRPLAATIPSTGTAKPIRSAAAPEARRIPNGIIHLDDTRTRSATTLTESAPTKFDMAAYP